MKDASSSSPGARSVHRSEVFTGCRQNIIPCLCTWDFSSHVVSCNFLCFFPVHRFEMSNCCCKNASMGFVQRLLRQVTVAPSVFCEGFFKGYLLPRFSPSSSFYSVSINIHWWSICITGCLVSCVRNAPLHSLAFLLTEFTFCFDFRTSLWWILVLLEEVSGVYRVM